jgi:class 3 adenylate cyclase
VITLQTVELGVLGPLQVRQYGLPVAIPGAKPRAILTMLGLHGGSVVSADTLLELLWGDDPPRTAAKALQTHISSLRRTLGDGFVLTAGTGWTLSTTEIDATLYKSSVRHGRDAVAAGDTSQAVVRFDEALVLWRGVPELPDGSRGTSEKTRWIEGHAALVEDRADALLATGRAAEIIGDLEAAIADAPLRERRWGQLMLALYRAGRQGEALGAYQRARSLLAKELGVDPGPDLRRLEAAIVAQDDSLEIPVSQQLTVVTRAVTFLLTDIEGSTAAWEVDADAMAVALARHDELVEQVVTSRGGRLVKTRGEGDATFSVFDRPSAAAVAAIDLQEAIRHEPWALVEPLRIRVALHTGEVELRDGDYFGRAVNRAARLRSLAAGGQILCSGATAELVIDTLPDDVVLADLGMRQLKNLARPEHVFDLRLENADDSRDLTTDAAMERPELPAVLAGPGPFVGRGPELERLLSAWQTTLDVGTGAVLIAGEPGVGKTRLAGEWSRHAYEQGAVVLYGRCDEDLGAPYQPFAEALRSLVPCLGASRLRGLRGVEALLPLVPGLADALPDLAAPSRAGPDTERYALFDAVVATLGVASASAPVVLILDDLHWAAKPTLLLLRHLLRFGERARVLIVGTYRSTDLDRSHPLAAMLADLHRDGSASRLALSGLDEGDVTAYVAEAGYDDEELARALATVTGGNPFFLIEALRHVDESGGRWDPSTLPQGVREAVSRRLSQLPAETNKALAAAAVVGSHFGLALVESVVGGDLVDAFDEASRAGIVIEEPGGRYRFNHAIVRQSLLAELASVRRMRLHQKIAATLETEPGADDELLAELAYHYFECAWAGNAAKAVEYCRRAADQAMARLAYEGAADLYGKAWHALEEIDDELPDRDDQQAELLVARCEALLAAGDVASATGAVSQLLEAAGDSDRLAAWGACFEGQLSMLTDPERLDEIESAVSAAAETLAGLDDAAGEAKAHTVRAGCLARLGRIGDCETALDQALTAARRAGEHRRVNAVLAQAPLAALWGPNPVPRAGGRCLDVVRLLRITTGSPVVEATSTRCQGVLDAFRGRAAAGRQLIDSARRTVTELGMRHARLEVDQFAGIVELVADDPAAAEPHLRQAYNGFRRMGLDVDTAETAALLARACLALDRDAEADELCAESERLAGHALKASIAWRTVRAKLLSRGGAHDDARRMAEDAVAMAGRTDALVDHGDACLALATVLGAADDTAGARVAADQAVGLYERKGAAALAEKAHRIVGKRDVPAAPAPTETPVAEPENACVRAIRQLSAAIDREAWHEYEQMFATDVVIESRRKIVGFHIAIPSREWAQQVRRLRGVGAERHRVAVIAVRGERLALTRLEIAAEDASPGAPQEEVLELQVINAEGRFELGVFFDPEDIDVAMAELDAAHAKLQERPPLENAASRLHRRLWTHFLTREWEALAETMTDDAYVEDHRPVVNYGLLRGRDAVVEALRVDPDLGLGHVTPTVVATRGERLVLSRLGHSPRDKQPEAFHLELITVVEIDDDGQMAACIVYDAADSDAAFAELDARYLAGEGAPYACTWSAITSGRGALNRRELPPTTPDWVTIDHRRVAAFAPGEGVEYLHAGWNLDQQITNYIERVHRVSDLGAVFTWVGYGTSQEGFVGEWRGINLVTVDGEMINRAELFDEADLDAAIAKFDELNWAETRLGNAASNAGERFLEQFAAGNWEAMAGMLADDYSSDDRRRVVNAGMQQGRGAEILNMQAIDDLWFTNVSTKIIGTRGKRLGLGHARYSGRDEGPEGGFVTEILGVIEINADERISSMVVFDPDDVDAAFGELDARYLAGEAAPYAHTWSVVAGAYAALDRHELPAIAQDWVNVDRRRLATIEAGHLAGYVHASLDAMPECSIHVEAVHRLSELGVVVTRAVNGRSQVGFDAEWREIDVLTIDGDLINRCEVFDETDVDAALARFEELSAPTPRLENTATRTWTRLADAFNRRDIVDFLALTTADGRQDDRRKGLHALLEGPGRRQGVRALFEVLPSSWRVEVEIIATRGSQLCLTRERYRDAENADCPITAELLTVMEVTDGGLVRDTVDFDSVDIDAALDELESRYLAGEAAPHAHTWSVIAKAYAGFNQREPLATTLDWGSVDHRRGAAFAPGDMNAYLQAAWDDSPDTKIYIAAVHRLSNLGVVVTHVAHGISREGFGAKWRDVHVLTVEGDAIGRFELFDEADIDAAIARFDEISRPAPRLENAASQVAERFLDQFAARDWDAMAEMLADDYSSDDRRRVVNAGVRHGRDAEIINLQAIEDSDVGFTNVTSTVIATRGARLTFIRARWSGRDQPPDAFNMDMLHIVEVGADERMSASITFDLDDVDAAFTELDARYLAGEAAAHADTWAVIAGAVVALNRRELPAMTPGVISIDNRRVAGFAPGEGIEFIRVGRDLDQTLNIYIEAVHRMSSLGAVCTWAGHGTSHEGFDAEWRVVELMMVEGDLISQIEIFDESDIDAAIAKFDELSRPTPRLENAASRVYERIMAYFAACDWDAVREILAEDISTEDRRRVVNAGRRQGRDTVIAEILSIAEIGVTKPTSEIVATRGGRLALSRGRASVADQQPQAFRTDLLDVVEVDADDRMVARIVFDIDDIHAAFEELDARYLAGEAAPHAHTWSVIARAYAEFNRRELLATPPDWVNIDHRRGAAFAPGDMIAYMQAAWDDSPDTKIYIAAVHRLDNLGAVVTHVAHGISREGFDAEWRDVHVLTVEGDAIGRSELFDEADVEAALATFDQLSNPARSLENAASRASDRLFVSFAARDWASMSALLADDFYGDDRRQVMNVGLHDRDAVIESYRTAAEFGIPGATTTVLATRAERLVLAGVQYSVSNEDPDAFHIDLLQVVEIDGDERISGIVTFDIDEIDAAFEELDARYLAGEAAKHSDTWSLIARTCAAFNRHVMPPTTPDWVNVDHRKVTAFAPGDMTAYMRATFGVAPDIRFYIEAVHRLSDLGAVFTQAGRGISHEGFEAEWRDVILMSIEGDQFNRCEVFDEADMDAALARFDELSRPVPRLENAASQVTERFWAHFMAREWDAIARQLAQKVATHDRRRVVNSGVLHGRDSAIAAISALAEVGVKHVTSEVIAVRGERLVLSRTRSAGSERPESFRVDALDIIEIDADGRIASHVAFDLDDIGAAFDDLDGRYVAGEAAAYAHAFSLIAGAFAANNRRELPKLTPDWVNIDHRRGIAFAPGDMTEYIRAIWDDTPDVNVYIEAVHGLSHLGAVITQAATGTSQQGFAAEWRAINISTVDGDLINRCELFDETDIDAALARFDELNRPAP